MLYAVLRDDRLNLEPLRELGDVVELGRLGGAREYAVLPRECRVEDNEYDVLCFFRTFAERLEAAVKEVKHVVERAEPAVVIAHPSPTKAFVPHAVLFRRVAPYAAWFGQDFYYAAPHEPSSSIAKFLAAAVEELGGPAELWECAPVLLDAHLSWLLLPAELLRRVGLRPPRYEGPREGVGFARCVDVLVSALHRVSRLLNGVLIVFAEPMRYRRYVERHARSLEES